MSLKVTRCWASSCMFEPPEATLSSLSCLLMESSEIRFQSARTRTQDRQRKSDVSTIILEIQMPCSYKSRWKVKK